MHFRLLCASVASATLALSTCDLMAQDAFSLEAAPEETTAGGFIIYDSEVELGPGYTTSDSFKFREYNGLPSKGPFAIANARVRGRAPADDETPFYFDLVGTNLGLTSRYIRGDFGVQGDYSAFLEYDQIPHLRFDDGSTPYIGTGSSNLTLPGGWVGSDTTAGLTTLLPDLAGFNVETERREIGLGFDRNFNRQWKANLAFSHQDKEGTDVIGSVFATNGGNPRGATIGKPIDFKTDQVNLGLDYAGDKGQFHLGYEFSYFQNNAGTLRFQNAFTNPLGGNTWAAGAGFPTGVGEFALAPDNMAHNLVFSGGYNLPARTRLTLNASFSHYRQDADLLPYTANSLLTVNTPVPRGSADAEVNNYLLKLAASSRPATNWDLNGSYRYFNRDNNTPQDVFVRIVGDAQNQPVGVANGNARINLPYSYQQHQVKLGAGYRLMSRTKLSVGYEFDRNDKDYQEVDYTTEHTLSAKIRGNPMDNVSGWLKYAYTMRDNSGYQGNAPFLAGHTPEYLATLTPDQQFENNPGLRKFYLADLKQNGVRGVLNYTPSPAWGITVDANYLDGDYTDSPVGLQNRKMGSGTLDVSYSPSEDLNTHAFLTYENRKYDELGCSFNPNNPACVDSPPAPQQQWTADTVDNSFTAGIGGEWKIGSKWKFGADYLFTKSTTNIDVSGGQNLQPLFDLPELDSLRHRLGLRLDYQLRKQLRLRMSYLYEHLDSEDFALNGVEPNSVEQLITLGNQSPSYDAHVFGVTLAYQWD